MKRLSWGLGVSLLVFSCGHEGAVSTGDPDAGDPEPVITAEQWQALVALRYDEAPPPVDPSNAVVGSLEARRFGRRMFFDTAFSGPLIDRDNDGSTGTLGRSGEAGRVSCASCHVAADGFLDTRSPHKQISLAAKWTARRTPTLLEIAYSPLYNWDGRRDSLWSQAIGVMESATEFNSGRLFVAEQIFRLHRDEYEALFGALPPLDDEDRFPPLSPKEAGCDEGPEETAACRGKPGYPDYDTMDLSDQDLVTRVSVNMAKAIAAYVTELRCGPGRFDAWIDGDDSALTRAERRGAALFVGRARCATCHSGPYLSDFGFHNVGLRPATVAVAFTDTDDRGAAEGIAAALHDPLSSFGVYSDGDRGALPDRTGTKLEGAFKTPSLRCVASRPSFMHTGQMRTLEEVVGFFDRGGDGAGFPGISELSPLGLTDLELADLAAFLHSFEGPGPDAHLLEPPPN
jgi:cytochrome c peroxidase